jgi:hypothetical protein
MATIQRSTTTVTRTEDGTPVKVTRVTTKPIVVQRPSAARGWLKALGWLLIVTAVLGLVGYVQDVAHDYAFHLEGIQDALHWVLGIAVLVLAYAVRNNLAVAIITIGVGVVLLGIGVLGFLYDGFHAGVGDSAGHLLLGTISLLVGVVALNRERDAQQVNRVAAPPIA